MTTTKPKPPPTQPQPHEIRATIADAGISQARAAELLGVTTRQVERWCSDSGEWPIPAAPWALLRARLAVLAGDTRGALAVLRETTADDGGRRTTAGTRRAPP